MFTQNSVYCKLRFIATVDATSFDPPPPEGAGGVDPPLWLSPSRLRGRSVRLPVFSVLTVDVYITVVYIGITASKYASSSIRILRYVHMMAYFRSCCCRLPKYSDNSSQNQTLSPQPLIYGSNRTKMEQHGIYTYIHKHHSSFTKASYTIHALLNLPSILYFCFPISYPEYFGNGICRYRRVPPAQLNYMAMVDHQGLFTRRGRDFFYKNPSKTYDVGYEDSCAFSRASRALTFCSKVRP